MSQPKVWSIMVGFYWLMNKQAWNKSFRSDYFPSIEFLLEKVYFYSISIIAFRF